MSKSSHNDRDIDNFIGSTFTSEEGGILKIVGKETRGNKYLLTCSICSEDQELFPDKFSMTKGNLKRGSLPCACSTKFIWNKEQQKVRIIRKCRGASYEALCGFLL